MREWETRDKERGRQKNTQRVKDSESETERVRDRESERQSE